MSSSTGPAIACEKIGRLRIVERKEFLFADLCVLCVLAVNAGQHFHREDAKDAKKTLRRLFWWRLGRSVLPSRKSFTSWKRFFGQDYFYIPRPDPRISAESAFISGPSGRTIAR